jgi:hypothetical protein
MKQCIIIFVLFLITMNYIMISIICNRSDLISSIMLLPWSILIFIAGYYSGKVISEDRKKNWR